MEPKTNRNFKGLLGQIAININIVKFLITSNINTVKFLVCVFPIQQLLYHHNIVVDKGLFRSFLMNELLNLCICALKKKSAPHLPEGTVKCVHTCGTIANSQTNIRCQIKLKKGDVAKVRILVELGIL